MPTCPVCRVRYDEPATLCAADGAALLPDQAFIGAEVPLAVGATVGEYRVEGLLGEGGFGSVYAAVHPVIGKRAAIKVLKREFSSNPEVVSRFISEARAVNQIRHRNIIDIFAFGVLDDGRHYYVMELLEGTTLDGYMKQYGRLAPSQALPILRQLARALGAAHASGIAHRDLKPENVFLTFDEDGQPIPKLLDFGIAKLLGEAGARHKTQSGAQMGTPYYMSPEQIHGRAIDTRTDVYSFGVMTYELLTGEVPFDGESVMDLMMKHLTVPAPPMSGHAQLPTELDAPVQHMMEKESAKRPSSIVQAVDELISAATRMGLVSGIAVPPAAISLGGGGGPPSSQAAVIARSGQHDVDVGGRTMAVPEGTRTLVGAETNVAPKGRSKAALLAAVVAVGIGLGAVAAWKFGGAPAPTNGAAAAAPPSAGAPPPSASPEPLPTPSASAPLVAPADASAVAGQGPVKLRLKVVPPGAEVFLGETRLGSADEELPLPRGDAPVELVVKKQGFLPSKLTVTPNADVADAVILTALPPQKKDYTW